MKRVYKSVGIQQVGATFAITLDGRPLKTPGGATLALRAAPLAQAIAAEWAGQGDTIDQSSMSLTRLANTAVDHVEPGRQAALKQIETYVRHDLVCYRSAEPLELAAREAAAWDVPLLWARAQYGLDLNVTTELSSIEQPSFSFDSIAQPLSRFDAFALTGLVAAAGILKSVVLALSLADGRLDAHAAHAAAHVDALFQAEKWGRDSEAEARLRNLLAELETAERFLRLGRLQN